jgi:hypothetical protein
MKAGAARRAGGAAAGTGSAISLAHIGIAAQRWFQADEGRKAAAALVRKAAEVAREAPLMSAAYLQHLAAQRALQRAAKAERAARRDLRRLCAGASPEVVDVTTRAPAAALVLEMEPPAIGDCTAKSAPPQHPRRSA